MSIPSENKIYVQSISFSVDFQALPPPFFFLYVFYNKLLWVARSLSYADIINSFFMADIDIFLWVCGVGPPDFGP